MSHNCNSFELIDTLINNCFEKRIIVNTVVKVFNVNSIYTNFCNPATTNTYFARVFGTYGCIKCTMSYYIICSGTIVCLTSILWYNEFAKTNLCYVINYSKKDFKRLRTQYLDTISQYLIDIKTWFV